MLPLILLLGHLYHHVFLAKNNPFSSFLVQSENLQFLLPCFSVRAFQVRCLLVIRPMCCLPCPHQERKHRRRRLQAASHRTQPAPASAYLRCRHQAERRCCYPTPQFPAANAPPLRFPAATSPSLPPVPLRPSHRRRSTSRLRCSAETILEQV